MDRWIDCELSAMPGLTGYLVETVHDGKVSWSLRERPLRTNQSNEPRLMGWCGETNNRSRTAHGVVEIVKVNKANDRAMVARLRGERLASFLESDGYPELIPR